MGPTPPAEEKNMDLISASKDPVTMEIGASLFDSSSSFCNDKRWPYRRCCIRGFTS